MLANILGNSFQYDILSVVPYPMLLVGRNGEIIYMNERAKRFYQPLQKQRKLKHISSLVEHSYQRKWEEKVEEAVHSLKTIEIKLSFFFNPLKTYKVSITPYLIHNEVMIGMMVHKRKRKSLTLKKESPKPYHNVLQDEMKQELVAVKNLLESFIENTSDAIMLVDESGCILCVNQAFENLYGWKKEAVVGNDIITVFHNYKDEVAMLFNGVRNGESFKNVETIRYHANGTPLNVSITASPIKNGEGAIYGISSIIRDITDQKNTEELLRKSEKLAIIGQLAAGVAHEIRNPLTSLKGFLQLFHEMRMTNKDILQVMLGEIDRIEMITDEFLSLAKPHVTKFEYHSINDILQQVVKLGEIEGGLANVTIDTAFDSCMPIIYGDMNKLKQVFSNIMKNSIEAVDEKGIVSISTVMKRDSVSIFITDNGTGIEASRLKHMGEPFYSTKEKGTGLGLMISRKIIEEHEGDLVIASEIGKGTTVEIRLPCLSFQR